MSVLIFIVMFVAIIAFVMMSRKNRNRGNLRARTTDSTQMTIKKNEPPPYYRKKTLLNEKEQVLFHRLIEAMPGYYVMAQVRLADIVGVKAKKPEFWTWFNPLKSKSVDFVICDKTLAILACIELDGKTHDNAERQKADQEKDLALNTAGIPILRIEANKITSTEEIKALLEKILLHKND